MYLYPLLVIPVIVVQALPYALTAVESRYVVRKVQAVVEFLQLEVRPPARDTPQQSWSLSIIIELLLLQDLLLLVFVTPLLLRLRHSTQAQQLAPCLLSKLGLLVHTEHVFT